MIFVITGSHSVGFDRLVRLTDRVAARMDLDATAQIGVSQYVPNHLAWFRFCSETQYYSHLDAASVVITHGGYAAVEAVARGKAVVAVPRRPEAKEALDDHQVEFVEWLRGRGLVEVTETVEGLAEILSNGGPAKPKGAIASRRQELHTFLKRSVDSLGGSGLGESIVGTKNEGGRAVG